MKLPKYIASTAVRETGLVRAQDIGALTNVGAAEFQAIEQAGRAIGHISDLGARAYMNRQALDDIIESGVATQRVQESWNKAEESVRNFNPAHDMPLPDAPKYLETLTTFGTKERDAFLQSLLEDIEKDATKIFKGVRSAKTKAQLVGQYNEFYADRAKDLKGELNKILNDYQIDEMSKLARAAALNADAATANLYIERMVKHGLITNVTASKLKTNLMKEFFQNSAARNAEATIAALNQEMAARKKGKGDIPEDIMTDADLHQSLNNALTIQKENIVAFENDINAKLVAIDNTPDLSQADFDSQSRILKASISLANIPGTQKRKMLADLERWRRGTSEIDYARILALNQEMDAAQRSGIVDPTIEDRITNASLEGAFGGRNKGGQKNYGIMIRRFEKLKFDERVQVTVSIVNAFERENADDPRLIFLFHQAKNKIITENPDASMRDLFVSISALAEAYSVLPESTIIQEMTQGDTGPKRKPQEVHAPPGPAQGTIPSTKQLEGDLKAVQMQSPTGVPIRAAFATIGHRLDRGDVFPPGSNVRVKRNPTDKDITFEGLTIKPGKRVISLDGGTTWQLLP